MSINIQGDGGNKRLGPQLRLLITVIGLSAVLVMLYLIGQL